QRVVKAQDRESIRDLPAMVARVKRELAPIEEQWGVVIHEFGFSTFSPTPETLEITQLRKLAEEKLGLFRQFRKAGLAVQAALTSGSVVALRPTEGTVLRKAPAGLTAVQAAPTLEQEVELFVSELEGEEDGEAKKS